MFFRPASPLSVCLLIAFVLLLLSTISTPIIKGIPLAEFHGVSFGVWGYCESAGCSNIGIGYSYETQPEGVKDTDFTLPLSTRHSLSSILIIHPVAALLCLICLGLAIAAHFHSPAHSPRYLLALLILTIPTVLCSLLAFLVDILVFVPHVAWGGWIVLAATILIILSMVITCAMRRTLVSRKARKKRIAENDEMNGNNYYANRAAQDAVVMEPTYPKAESPPPMPNEPISPDGTPHYASFELQQPRNMDDKTPLNPRNPSVRSQSTNGGPRMPMGGPGSVHGSERGVPPMPGPPPGSAGRGMQRDQYGNPIAPNNGQYGMAGSLRHQNSNGTMGSARSGGPPPPGYGGRGRGGYPPPRGGFPPRGGNPRGGPQGMRGPPPPGWNGGPGRGGPPPPGWQGNGRGGAMMGRGQRGPPPGYDNGYYDGPGAQGRRDQSPGPYGMEGQNGQIGQAIEMDSRNGMQRAQTYELEGEGAVQSIGMAMGGPDRPHQRTGSDVPNPSAYSGDESYVPPRAGWAQHSAQNSSQNLPRTQPTSPEHSLSPPGRPSTASSRHRRMKSDEYYEDVDPRFAQPSSQVSSQPLSPQDPRPMSPHHALSPPQNIAIPASLMPGHQQPRGDNSFQPGAAQNQMHPPQNPHSLHPHGPPHQPNLDIGDDADLDRLTSGQRSPAASETSNFTSVSQRGVNPHWAGGGPNYAYGPHGGSNLGPGPQGPRRGREDVLLAGNPDFQLPGVGAPGRGGRGGGRGGAPGRSQGPVGGLTGVSRYPGAI
ncbi:pali-domain-containing protein [Aulographum hederae CBS 113979]|uniref:Pali-domain-containing protein n=1 Tax=Aulographum hederae CBS 113979 TaxID=1176131 RepID=A0A6G1GST6_9PEZI|nr:pali-domain-containing protein [Aulographum hederae CBS 113979]